jgi:hypothetical protein
MSFSLQAQSQAEEQHFSHQVGLIHSTQVYFTAALFRVAGFVVQFALVS